MGFIHMDMLHLQRYHIWARYLLGDITKMLNVGTSTKMMIFKDFPDE